MQCRAASFTAGGPSFRVPVGSVLLARSKPEMINANTCRIIASVKHPKAVAHMPVMQHPTETVRAAILSVPFVSPVSVVEKSSRPYPARPDVPVDRRIGSRPIFVNLPPKTLLHFWRKLCDAASSLIRICHDFSSWVRAARSVMNSAPLVPFNKKPAAVNTLCS